ncbi:MAG: hypothetical protein KDI75_00645 [Xanthomonadales bacterium]|nr:hypothetical protein [Xanthomonadales bacterium]
MKRTLPILHALFLLVMVSASAAVRAADAKQTITLHPGWNAVYVELEPNQADIEDVFAGIPVASVWRWIPTGAGPQFITDPAESLQNINGWFAWFPEPRPEAFLSNLFKISGKTAYLIKLEGSATRQLTITGKPRLKPVAWQPNAFTLTGLPVSRTTPPSFAEYFSASSAHQGQPVYTLQSNGQWTLINAPGSTSVEAGRAYWIYSKGNSNYQGRMRVVLDQGETLEFSAALTQVRVVLRNLSNLPGSFQLQRVGAGNLPLSYLVQDPETGEDGWPALQQALTVNVEAGGEAFVTLAVRRRDFSDDRMEQILAITDELGDEVQLFAGGNRIQPSTAPRALASMLGSAKQTMALASYAGLWVGDISINAVSEAQSAGTTPTPVGRPFAQRFLFHVDASGKVRLLKDVIQMWEDGVEVPSAEDPTLDEVSVPGRYVLLTDKALLSLYTGAVNRGGASVGVRYSTVAYDFDGDQLELGGGFGPGGQLSGNIVVESDLPTNPFLHKYHPDHDNLDEQFLNPRAEAYQVVRNVQLIFTEQDPTGVTPPGWGSTVLGGEYHESITGLHKNAIFTSGVFRVHRVSAVPVLNM